MTAKYTVIDSQVLSTSAASVTFSSIPGEYKDLVVVTEYLSASTNSYVIMRFNSDSASNYTYVYMSGHSSSTYSGSGSFTGVYSNYWTNTNGVGAVLTTHEIMDYSATDKHKSVLSRSNADNATYNGVEAWANRWANTAAITQIDCVAGNNDFAAGSTFRLLGVN